MTRPVIVLGGGGHAKVVIDALLRGGVPVLGVTDPCQALAGRRILGVKVLGNDEVVLAHRPEELLLANGLGSVGVPERRREIFERFSALGYGFASVIHPSAVISSDAEIGEGAQIMAGAVIQPGCSIGRNAIINTRASVDHDCIIGDHTHVAPGVTLSGGVRVGVGVHIGTGATVIQGIDIGNDSLVGAGALVLKTVPSGETVVGVPAKVVQK